MLTEYISYIKDNPKNYWFKRRFYGWGWTPVTWQGNLVLFLYMIVILFLAIALKKHSTVHEVSIRFILPAILSTIILIYICYKKGEKPKWQWGLRKK